jgi:hypothetical protein
VLVSRALDVEAPDLARSVATLRELVAGMDALRAVLLLDRGEGLEPAVVDCAADGSAEVEEYGEARALDPSAWAGVAPLELPHLAAPPELNVDLAQGTVMTPLGILDGTARTVRAAAELFPGQSVLTVGFATSEPAAPLFLAVRRGEPLVVSLGEAEYEMPADWPA